MHRVLLALEHSSLVGCRCICRLVVCDCALEPIMLGREQKLGKLGNLAMLHLFSLSV